MRLKQVSPAEYVIHAFGGVVKTAQALDRAPSSISEWKSRDGSVPTALQKKILTIAKKKNLPITEYELIFGGKIEK